MTHAETADSSGTKATKNTKTTKNFVIFVTFVIFLPLPSARLNPATHVAGQFLAFIPSATTVEQARLKWSY